MKRIGIIGSRRRNAEEDYDTIEEAFFDIYEIGDIIISGGCPKGGDRFAEIIAGWFKIPIVIHYPDKDSLPRPAYKWDFARINYERNTLIARDSDILIACVAPDRRGGTEDTIKKYLKFGKTRLILV
jgi:hypothetical protein